MVLTLCGGVSPPPIEVVLMSQPEVGGWGGREKIWRETVEEVCVYRLLEEADSCSEARAPRCPYPNPVRDRSVRWIPQRGGGGGTAVGAS